MRSDQAKTIPIHQYLEIVEGIKPDKVRLGGNELWYKSPIRKGDSTPSFKVDTILNLWYDHGLNKGGKIVDLVCELRAVSVREALSILDNSGLYAGGFSHSSYPKKVSNNSGARLFETTNVSPKPEKTPASEKEKASCNSSLQLLNVKALSQPVLIEYLQSRKIDLEIAKAYLTEVHFKLKDKLVQYFALGWKNGEGYELRNKYFKGFIGTGKTISVINPKTNNELLVFEGFMDFLAYLTYLKQEKNITKLKASVIILNSIALRKHVLPIASKYQFSKAYFFLDNDDSGKETLDYFQQALEDTEIKDMSEIYAGYKDFNDMLCQKKQIKH